MQTYAFSSGQCVVSARLAERGKDYFCLECGSILRLRGGKERQVHFYHLTPPLKCRAAKKSHTHLALQYFFKNQLSPEPCHLEYPFGSISRIADLYVPQQKRVFEIQVSPISALEVEARTTDYATLGIQVVWILHTKTFNKRFVSKAEHYLQNHPHYFSSLLPDGSGMLFDQFCLIDKDERVFRSAPLSINIRNCHSPKELSIPKQFPSQLRTALILRKKRWRFGFGGDLVQQLAIPESSWLKSVFNSLKDHPPKKDDWKIRVLSPFKLMAREALRWACHD